MSSLSATGVFHHSLKEPSSSRKCSGYGMTRLKSKTLSSLFTVSRNFSNSSFGPVMYKSHSHQFGINPPCPGRRTGGPVQFTRQASSVFGQQHQSCERAVRPRDDPELDAIGGVISGQEPGAVAKRLLIPLPVLAADVSPITPHVRVKGGGYVDVGENLQGGWCADHPPCLKKRLVCGLDAFLPVLGGIRS